MVDPHAPRDLKTLNSYTAGTTTFANNLYGVDTAQTGTNDQYYTWTPTGKLASLTTTAGTSYYITDPAGSVLTMIDQNGDTTANYTYDPYGNTLTATGTQAATNPYRYNGGYTDPTGYIHYGNRYYNPTLANWTQQDPSGQSTGYQYAGSNPVNNSDPSGNLGSCLGSGINPFTLYSYNNGVLVSRTCYHPGPPPALTFACALAVVLSILGAGTAFVAAPGTLGGSIVAYGGAVGSAVGPAFACH
ncbi:MAG: RHS repeat-associated core domain-containing protein [Actinomycetota bacterium]|nr:RHS repeat-associated core domain-containing protein [Actinomycetota bacterium]